MAELRKQGIVTKVLKAAASSCPTDSSQLHTADQDRPYSHRSPVVLRGIIASVVAANTWEFHARFAAKNDTGLPARYSLHRA
jgi:hypothetical protein